MKAYIGRLRAASEALDDVRDKQEADEERRHRDGGPWEEDQRFHELNNAAWSANSEWWNALFNRGREDSQEATR